MKKIFLLALITLMVVGCMEDYRETRINSDYSVKVIDSCEYIVNTEKYAYAYTEGIYKTHSHKGNCRFCKERRQKELEELVEQLKEK